MKKKHSLVIIKIFKKIREIILRICLDKKIHAKKHFINYLKKKNRISLLKERKKKNNLKTSLFFSKKKIMRFLLKKNNKYKNQKLDYNIFKSEINFKYFYEEISISQPFNLKFFFFSRYFIGSSYYLNSFATLERFQTQLRVYNEIFKNDFRILVAGNEQQKKLSKIISNTLSKNIKNIKLDKTKQHYIKQNKKNPNVILFLDSLHQEFLLNQSYYFDDIITFNFFDDLTQTTTFSTIFPNSPEKDLETSYNLIRLFQKLLNKKTKKYKKRIAQW